jgi:TonB family protein
MRHLHYKYIFAAFLAMTLFATAGSAAAHGVMDAPPTVVPGSCLGVEFNRAELSSIVKVDLVVQVDDAGSPVSTSTLDEVSNSIVLSAVTASAMTCKFRPAIKDGKAVAGTVRQLYQFNPPTAAGPLGRRAAIVDAKSCAPTADDYPLESRRLNETGTTRVAFTVAPNGKLAAFGVARTSGFLSLDFTALIKLASCKFQSATTPDGTPKSETFVVDYVWKLE